MVLIRSFIASAPFNQHHIEDYLGICYLLMSLHHSSTDILRDYQLSPNLRYHPIQRYNNNFWVSKNFYLLEIPVTLCPLGSKAARPLGSGEVNITIWRGIFAIAASKEKDALNLTVGIRPTCNYIANLINRDVHLS